MSNILVIGGIVLGVLILTPLIISAFLRDVEAGNIRLVSWLQGRTVIYRGPGKSKEIPLLTTGTTISSKVINIDLDITDQTADVGDDGIPRPIKIRVLASAIVSVGDSDAMIKTAANRYFAKPEADQVNTLTDLLSSSGRRALNLLTQDQLFSARTAPRIKSTLPATVDRGNDLQIAESEEDDPLSIIIRKACSRELTDLGLVFNSLNIKVVQSEVAEARRRQAANEAQANADIISAQQSRRAKEAQLEAERVISDRSRELEQTKASNAALIAQAEAKRQEALGVQRIAELDATQIAQARADAERVKIAALAEAEAEAIRIRTVATANAEAIAKVNEAIRQGGENYFKYRQIEMIPEIAPMIAEALSKSKLVTISGAENGGAAGGAAANITSVIQTILAAQLVTKGGLLPGDGEPKP